MILDWKKKVMIDEDCCRTIEDKSMERNDEAKKPKDQEINYCIVICICILLYDFHMSINYKSNKCNRYDR